MGNAILLLFIVGIMSLIISFGVWVRYHDTTWGREHKKFVDTISMGSAIIAVACFVGAIWGLL